MNCVVYMGGSRVPPWGGHRDGMGKGIGAARQFIRWGRTH